MDCRNCTKRSIHPNCHDTCEWYLEMKKKNEEKKLAREKELQWENEMITVNNRRYKQRER